MKINETLDYVVELRNKTDKKYDKLIYGKFIGILSDLKNRDLTINQLDSIETKLDTLNLSVETENKKKYLGSKLEEFKKFLKDKLSLISEGHYTAYGMSFGMLIGVLLQFYIGIYSLLGGMVIGMVIGGIMDSEARKQGRVLKTKLTE
jgi:hypothetical protein